MKVLLKLTYLIFFIVAGIATFNSVIETKNIDNLVEVEYPEVVKTYHIKDWTGKVSINEEEDYKILVKNGTVLKQIDYQRYNDILELDYLFLGWNEYYIILTK